MFTNRFSILTLLAVFTLGSLPCSAQVGSFVELQFLAFPKKLKPEPIELLVGENKTIQVQTPGNELSPIYKISRNGRIIVGETIENEEGKSEFLVYGSAGLIDSSKQIVLLFRKGEKKSDGFVVLPINGDLSDFSGGSYLFVNASRINVAGAIGGKKFDLGPGEREMLQPKATHPGGACQATFAYMKKDEWKVFKDTRWTTSKRYRSLIFFHQHPTSGRLMISPVVDMLPYVPPNTG